MAEERNVRKVRVGKVVSNKMDGELLKFLKDKNKSDVRRNRR
ncbi:MAG: hypothetical protein E6309_01075 [Veillonella sp.]|nr:hypothetical protein [Veillonella sp.]